ncbi:hypothetical protein FXB40_36645 [Bradyrhizobium rifense]|uniref:Uncharacterized protein n=1 Tax=Bradyrhizobium rifense TaxID=515499 RepID=A0A5D3K642_9BRAD|nr:hypothetical protein [Bradyrhizobium rifense]TYL89124.1 hypothetical protein FXB40_36645 [Bradyrhizobium rifense]
MSTPEQNSKLLYWAGVALGPAAWATNLQGVYVITHFACHNTASSSLVIGTILILVALAGSLLSARAVYRGAGSEWADARGGGPRTFMAWLGVGSGMLFALVIANQLIAASMVNSCLR